MSDQSATPAAHPLLRVGKQAGSDLLSTLVFAGVYAVSHDAPVAVALGIAVGLGQIVWLASRRVPIDAMQWLSLFLVIVFGGAALVTKNPLLIMLKPTLAYVAVGLVMLKPGWMNRYVPDIVRTTAPDVTTAFGYAWAALMFVTGAANLVLAWHASAAAWGWFIGVFPITSKVALVLAQFYVTRAVVRGRRRAVAAAVG